MEWTSDESKHMPVENDGSCCTELPDYVHNRNLSDGAHVLFGQNIIAVQPKRTVTTEANEEEYLVSTYSIGSTALQDDQIHIKVAKLKN